MSSVDELRRQLAALQSAPTNSSGRHRLSERNAVDVLRLYVQPELGLIYTVDGRAFLTPGQLEREIRDAVAARGGRIDLVELGPLLSVDAEVVTEAVDTLVKRDGASLFLLADGQELMSRQCVRAIVREVIEALRAAESGGELSISELARSFEVPADFLADELARARHSDGFLGSCTMSGDRLFTQAHVDRVDARARGALIGVSSPVALRELARRHRLAEAVVRTTAQTLLRTGRLKGALRGGGLFVPESFEQARAAWTRQFFRQNQFVEFQALKRLAVDEDPRLFLDRVLEPAAAGDMLTLESVAVSASVVGQLSEFLRETELNQTWLDVSAVLPSVLTAADRRQLLSTLETRDAAAVAVRTPDCAFVASADFVAHGKRLLVQFAKDRPHPPADPATQPLAADADRPTSLLANRNQEVSATARKKARRAEKKEKRDGNWAPPAPDAGDPSADSGQGNGCVDAPMPAPVCSDFDPASLGPLEEQACRHVLDVLQGGDVAGVGVSTGRIEVDAPELVQALWCEHWRAAFLDAVNQERGRLFKEAAEPTTNAGPRARLRRPTAKEREQFQAGVSARVAYIKHLASSTDHLFELLTDVADDRGAAVLGNVDRLRAELDKHLLKSLCADVFQLLVRREVQLRGEAADDAAPADLWRRLPEDDPVTRALAQLRAQKTAMSWLRVLTEQAAPALELRFRPVDSRALVFSQRKLLEQQLVHRASALDSDEAFMHKLLLYLFIRLHGRIVHLPVTARHAVLLLEATSPRLLPSAGAILRQAVDCVQERKSIDQGLLEECRELVGKVDDVQITK